MAIPNGNSIGNSNGHRICHLKKDVVLKELECYEETRLFEETRSDIESSVDKKGKEKKRMDQEEIMIDEKEISIDILTRIWNFEEAKEKGSGEALNINKILNDTSFTIEEGPPVDFDFMDMIIDKNQKDKSFISKENVKENMAKFDVTSFIKRKNSSFHKEF